MKYRGTGTEGGNGCEREITGLGDKWIKTLGGGGKKERGMTGLGL